MLPEHLRKSHTIDLFVKKYIFFTHLSCCMAEKAACRLNSWFNLYSRSVIVQTGSHSAVGGGSRSRLSLQHLQDGLDI